MSCNFLRLRGFPLIALTVLGACQVSPPPDGGNVRGESTIELDRIQWRIGELEAETVVFLDDESPSQRTTVWNNNAETLWWQDFDLNRYHYLNRWNSDEDAIETVVSPETGGITEISLEGGGGGGGSSTRCARYIFNFNESSNDHFRMEPGGSRVIEGAVFSASVKASECRSWSLSGFGALPSAEPFSDWPPLAFDIKISWDEAVGCSLLVVPRDEP